METNIPKTSAVLAALMKADFTTLVRNRRSAILALLVPIIILISWKGVVDKLGGAFALSTAITIGLMAIGLMGYSISIARDRDKGIFQRLRVAPVPSWAIMLSRLSIQMFMIMLLTVLIFIVGYQYDHISLSAQGYALTFFVAFVGGAVYLSLGQLIVGLVKNPETVNATTRLVYFIFIMVGMFGEMGVLGDAIRDLVHWSPYGAVKLLLAASMEPAKWTGDTNIKLLVTIAYIIAFSVIGIKKFQWNNK